MSPSYEGDIFISIHIMFLLQPAVEPVEESALP